MKQSIKFLLPALMVIMAFPALAIDDLLDRYRVDTAVWCSGDLRGQPVMTMAPGEPETFTINAGETRWRLKVEVEPSAESEGAIGGAVWLRVDIEQEVDGEWEFITDTIIGTPLGQPGRITLVGDSEEESTPTMAPLYVELTTTRVDDSE